MIDSVAQEVKSEKRGTEPARDHHICFYGKENEKHQLTAIFLAHEII
jgi:hypothetical protein